MTVSAPAATQWHSRGNGKIARTHGHMRDPLDRHACANANGTSVATARALLHENPTRPSRFRMVWAQTDQYLDPWADLGLSLDPTTRDRHAYAGGNPVGFVDTNGRLRTRPGGGGCSSRECQSKAEQDAAVMNVVNEIQFNAEHGTGSTSTKPGSPRAIAIMQLAERNITRGPNTALEQFAQDYVSAQSTAWQLETQRCGTPTLVHDCPGRKASSLNEVLLIAGQLGLFAPGSGGARGAGTRSQTVTRGEAKLNSPCNNCGGFGLDDLSAAGRVPSKGGLTRAGYEYEKHMGRGQLPKVTGPRGNLDKAGQSLLDDILTSPGSTTTTITGGRFAGGTRVVGPNGQGAVFGPGGNFGYFGIW